MTDTLAAFTDEELAFVRTAQLAEIRVNYEGRLEISYRSSPEWLAARLHDMRSGDTASPALCARPREKVEAALAASIKALHAINRRASPGGERTFDVAIRDLEWIVAEARLAISDIATLTEPSK